MMDKVDIRPLIKYLRVVGEYTNSDFAKMLGISVAYFNNKMNRNSFSITDLVIIAEETDCRIIFGPILHEPKLGAMHIDCSKLKGEKK